MKGAKITDERLRLTTDVSQLVVNSLNASLHAVYTKVLQGIRLIKAYAWEAFYANRVGGLRTKEINTMKNVA